jgi:hypothetical protein
MINEDLAKKVSELESRIKELEKEKRRDFLRNHNYFNMELEELDPQTIDILAEIEKDTSMYEVIPYLEEFYKRISQSRHFKWWLTLNLQQKRSAFKRIMDQVDSNWGESYLGKIEIEERIKILMKNFKEETDRIKKDEIREQVRELLKDKQGKKV